MRRAGAVLLAGAMTLTACAGGREPDPLEPMSLVVPAAGAGVLVSLPLEPDRPIRVNAVEPVFDDGLDVRYLGFVTRCGGLCGVTRLVDDEAVRAVERAVEGTVPFEATAGEVGPHLLLLVSFAEDDGAERLADAGCLVVRRIDLELADGEEIGVTRMGFRFLWVVATEDKPECLEGALLVS